MPQTEYYRRCEHCREFFHSCDAFALHVIAGRRKARCKSASQMVALGLAVSRQGHWILTRIGKKRNQIGRHMANYRQALPG